MSIRKALRDLAAAVADEAAQNPQFERILGEILEPASSPTSRRATPAGRATARQPKSSHRRHRRAPAVLDPVALAKEGEDVLRSRLASLDLEQLRDIVAEHGMDQGRLVMKWKTATRVIEKVVEISTGRAQKGDAFRS